MICDGFMINYCVSNLRLASFKKLMLFNSRAGCEMSRKNKSSSHITAEMALNRQLKNNTWFPDKIFQFSFGCRPARIIGSTQHSQEMKKQLNDFLKSTGISDVVTIHRQRMGKFGHIAFITLQQRYCNYTNSQKIIDLFDKNKDKFLYGGYILCLCNRWFCTIMATLSNNERSRRIDSELVRFTGKSLNLWYCCV